MTIIKCECGAELDTDSKIHCEVCYGKLENKLQLFKGLVSALKSEVPIDDGGIVAIKKEIAYLENEEAEANKTEMIAKD